jgi:hypothetical protein
MRQLTEQEYRTAFGQDTAIRRRALKQALDVRKFEIEQYWKRATYFWAFIAASLAGFGVVQTAKEIDHREQLSVAVGALGFVFSFAWWCVNSGSKRWQENWENHVDMLEDEFIGPLHKTVAGRPPLKAQNQLGPPPLRLLRHLMTGPSSFSVSKINQLVSIFVMLLWIPLLWLVAGPVRPNPQLDVFKLGVILLAAAFCALIVGWGRSDRTDYSFVVTQRTSSIVVGEPHASGDQQEVSREGGEGSR